ncbi:MAG: hypothetical protein CL609_12585 [Anaerolineaceae bacterium]|nr:hypothetical protein [Anaerolineaceae bacterium]
MATENKQPLTNCPVCGSKISENASRCLVCGTSLEKKSDVKPMQSEVSGPKLPSITLNLPVAIGLIIILMAIGAGVVFAVLQQTDQIVEPTATTTPTLTPTLTVTPTVTSTPTLEPTLTPLPDLEYKVQAGDSCLGIAIAFDVSVQSIIVNNSLAADCSNLIPGSTLLIPQPTPTPTAQPTATLSALDSTEAACTKLDYTVTSSDTLSSIARNYNVSIDSIKNWNNMSNDVVYEGQVLIIPLCERLPTPGPTPTATLPPPYGAPTLLLPADGDAFTAANDTIALQWSSVGSLRESEAYAVSIEDVTEGEGRRLVEYVTDTKFIVPTSFRPNDSQPHILRWHVFAVRQSGTGADGQPIYTEAGAISEPRTFIWWANISPTQTP